MRLFKWSKTDEELVNLAIERLKGYKSHLELLSPEDREMFLDWGDYPEISGEMPVKK